MGRARDILNYYRLDAKDFPEVKELIKQKLTERGKKWSSASGQNMTDIISILDTEFNDKLFLGFSRIARELDTKESELYMRERKVAEREKAVEEKEALIEYPFMDKRYNDVYILSVALRNSFKNRADMTDKEVQLRIIEMCENVLLNQGDTNDSNT